MKPISTMTAVCLALVAGMAVAPASAETNLHELLSKPRAERQSALQDRRAQAGTYSRSNASPIKRKMITFTDAPVGSIVIDTSDRRLYHVVKPGKAMVYGVGVGREGFTWTGTNTITRKAEWPGWTPPATMRAREAAKGRILPAFMPGGQNNPLGARALYLGNTLYRIHGTNQPSTIGQAMSSGCIRMANDDVTHLYSQVQVGTRVTVRR